ncbi:MAG: polysaccharide biosynthesis/export family protein [Bacteroidales bacterium]|nr:polysaccharide biosynthesis/export family protein [Bacteroidales bacterium]
MPDKTFLLKIIIFLSLGAFIFSSCVPMKKQIFMQVKEDTVKSEYINDKKMDYKLKPGNNLYVQVVSLEEDVSDFFNMGYGSSGNMYYDAAIYLNSYSVSDSGYVEMPFLGKIYVRGLTLGEIKENIQKRVDSYLYNTIVIVKIVNYNISVVGEVNRPGQFKIYQDKINIFEVLGLAGDMTVYAKRNDVKVIRKTEKGSKIYSLDLLDDNVLESELYYILPDDIVYVAPVKGRNFAFTSFPYTLVISSISLTIALFALFK